MRAGAGRRGGQHSLAGDMFDPHHVVDVRAQQLEHAGHAAVRSDAGQLRLHALEHRPLGFGTQVPQVQTKEGGGDRMEHQHRSMRVGKDVFTRLVEELKRQRDLGLGGIEHLRDVGDIGRPVGRASRHDSRNRAFQAGPDVGQCQSAGAAHETSPGALSSADPALGPGVWSKAWDGSKLMATTSSSRLASMARVKAGA